MPHQIQKKMKLCALVVQIISIKIEQRCMKLSTGNGGQTSLETDTFIGSNEYHRRQLSDVFIMTWTL